MKANILLFFANLKNANFKGSAPEMEPEDVDRIFKDLWNINDVLRYTAYYGDGDSKSFTKLRDAYQASGITVPKKVHWSCAEKGEHSAS